MPQQKPLTYPSLKCVLQYMDANERFNLSSRCPSLRKTVKSTPLEVRLLKLGHLNFTVNNKEYFFQYKENNTTKFLESQNMIGEGDVMVQGQSPYNILLDQAVREVDAFLKRMDELPMDLEAGRPYSSECDFHVEYTPEKGFGKPSFIPEGAQVHDVMRHLLGFILAGKSKVKVLELGISHGVLRIPKGLQLQVECLKIRSDAMAVLNSLGPIMTLPNRLILQIHNYGPLNLGNPVLENFEFLELDTSMGAQVLEPLALGNLKNKNIHIGPNSISTQDFLVIVEDWVRNPRDLGQKFLMVMEDYEDLFWLVKEQIGGAREGRIQGEKYEQCITIPLGAGLELNLYMADAPGHCEQLSKMIVNEIMVVMEVMGPGKATLV